MQHYQDQDEQQIPVQEQAEGDEENKNNEEEEEKKLPVKKRKKVEQYRLKPEHLTDTKKGMLYLYNLCKDYPFRNDELEELNRYMHVIEEWHYQLMPKYDFDYFTNRLQKFGGNNSVSTHLQFLRKAHKGLIPWHFVTNPLSGEQNNDHLENTVNTNTNESINVSNNIDAIQEEFPQNHLSDGREHQHEEATIPETLTSQRKPIKLSLKKQGQGQSAEKFQSQKKDLQVRFNDELQYEPTPKPIPEEEENLDDIFEQLEKAYQMKAEKKILQ